MPSTDKVANRISIGGKLRKSSIGVLTLAPVLATLAKAITVTTAMTVGGIVTTTLGARDANATCNGTYSNVTCTGDRSSTIERNKTQLAYSNITYRINLSDNLTLSTTGKGIDVNKERTGNIRIVQSGTATDTFTIDVGGTGLELSNTLTGATYVNMIKGIKAGGRGIDISTKGHVTVSARNISAGSDGIWIPVSQNNYNVTVSTTGAISAVGQGIYVKNSRGRVTMNMKDVRGGTGTTNHSAVNVIMTSGTRSATINSNGTLSGSQEGLKASLFATATHSIQVRNVTGGRHGVHLVIPRAFSFTATGTVQGGSAGRGIYIARGNSSALSQGNISITVSAVSAGQEGILIREWTPSTTVSGSITLTATDHVQGTTSGAVAGIVVDKRGSGDLSVTAEQVTGAQHGIFVRKYKQGTVSVTVSGTVLGKCGATTLGGDCSESAADAGISVVTDSGTSSTNIEVKSTGVASGFEGIYVNHKGTGALTITAAGDIVGKESNALTVVNSGANDIDTTPVINISVKDIESAKDGISVVSDSEGEGGIKIDVSQSADISADERGIFVENKDAGGVSISLSQSAKITTKKKEGIRVHQSGDGNVTVTASSGSEINSFSSTTTGGVTTISGDAGLSIYNGDSGGTVSVNLSGNVKAKGDGIRVYNKSDNTTTITANSTISGAQAGFDGIYVNNTGSGNVSITISGGVTGGGLRSAVTGSPPTPAKTGYALNLNSVTSGSGASGTGSISVTVNSGTISAASNGGAIKNGNGNATISFMSNAGLNGKVSLGQGTDQLSFSGSTITATSELDGGTQVGNVVAADILTFEGGASTANNVLTLDPAKILNWERINLNASTVWRFDGSKTITTPDFSLAGTISLQDTGGAAVGDSLTLSGGFNGNGTILVDVNFVAGTSDTITVTGNLAGTKSITIREVNPASTAARTSDDITVVTVTGTSVANGFSVTGGSFTSGGIPFRVEFRSASKTFVLVGGTAVTNCSEGSSGTFTCTGAISSSEVMVATGTTNITTTLDDAATTNVNTGVAFVLTGGNAVSFTQESGGRALSGGTGATGIVDARTTGNGNLTVTTVGAVTLAGSGTAIKATSTGTGNVVVTTANVTASHASGKAIEIDGKGSNVSLSAATIVGSSQGIVFKNKGNGSSNITITGSITSSGDAFYSYTKSGNTTINISGAITTTGNEGFDHVQGKDGVTSSGSISITTGSVKGKKGIVVTNYGDGAMTVTVNGSAESTNTTYSGSGAVEIFNYGKNGMTLNIGSGASARGNDGIYIFLATDSSGTTNVNVSGDVTGVYDEGIEIFSSISGNINVTISSDVTGSSNGISIENGNGGLGTVIINSGTITGGDSSIENNSGKIEITVNSNASLASGVDLGAGDDKLTFNGSNPGSSTKDFDGGTGAGTDVLTINNVSATLSATKFDNWEQIIFGTGTNIKFDGTQTLTTNSLTLSGSVVSLQDSSAGDALTLSRNVAGSGTINVDVNLSTGATDTITIGGNLTGTHKLFINDITPSNLSTPAQTITIISVTGTASANMISLSNARLPKLGTTKFNISYDTTAKAFQLKSIRGTLRCIESSQTAGQFSCSGAITSPENMVVGSSINISATLEATATVNVASFQAFSMEGGGAITFTQGTGGGNLAATGTATGVVHAKSTGNGAVSITLTGSASLVGSGTAIQVESTGTGNVVVSAANVTAAHASGTAIKIEGKGSNVSLSAATIIGSAKGIVFKNTGNGSSNINITGTITSSGEAFYSYTKSGNTTINISGAITTTGDKGFDHEQGKDGVTSSGTVSITTGSVKGKKGMIVTNYGDGAMTVTVNGSAESTNTTFSGSGAIEIFNYGKNGMTLNIGSGGSARGKDGIYLFLPTDSSGTTNVNVSGDVTGVYSEGIQVRSNNSGNINVTVSSDVTGSWAGILVENKNGGLGKVIINSGTITGGTSSSSIENNEGQIDITVNASGTLASGVDLEEGNDKLTFNGSNPSSSTKDFVGGDGTDVVTFKNMNTSINFTKFKEWEEFGFGSGANIVFNAAQILSVATVRFADGGTLSLKDNRPDDSLTISANVVGSGVFSVDTNLSTGSTDTIVISGNFSGTHKLTVTNVAQSTETQHSASINVLSVTGTTSSSALTLNGVPRFKGYLFNLEYDSSGTNKVFRLVAKRGNLLCVASTQTPGTFTCAGTINAPETLIADGDVAIRATLASDATVSVSSFKAISISGSSSVSFTQSANGGTINATGEASATIDAFTTGSGDVAVTLTGTATLQGAGTAVRAASTGTGAVTLYTAQVTASNANAMAIEARGSGGSVTVSASGTVSGGKNGITAFNHSSGAGTVTVSAGGTVTGGNATAVYAWNKGTGGVTVTASAINAGNTGVDVVNLSGGSVSVTVSGNVLSRNVNEDGVGIAAVNDSKGDGISVVSQGSAKVEGGYGIFVYNHGTGSVSVTSDGEIEGTLYHGLYAINEGNNTNISVKTVSGVTFGMEVAHYGTNTANIAIVTGGSVTGDEVGVRINSDGDVILRASGAITGTTNDGIYASQSGTANLTLSVTTVKGGTDGIQVVKTGTGNVTISATGAITATGENGEDGVYVSHSGSGTISVNVGAVSAGQDGVDVKKTGTGNITVVATGAIASTADSTEDGVYIGSYGEGNVSVTVASVTGDTDGLDLRNGGGGTMTVVANGAITGSGTGNKDAGIFIYNDASGGAISVSVGTNGTLNGHNGIIIEDEGGSNVQLNSSGAITGARGDGIYIGKTSTGNITLSVTEVSGKKSGLKINHSAGGNITATATSMVKTTATTESYSGVEVSGQGGSIGLTLAGASGTKHGIEVKTNGAGSISITTSDVVTGTTDGIRAFAEGQGNVSLTISGNVTAGSQGVGIDTKASSGTTTIIINSGDIGGQTSIRNLAGASVVTINNDAEFKGNVNLGAGVDQLTINSSKFNTDIRLDGGQDPSPDNSVDVLTFSSGTVTAVAANLRNWERITVAKGATLKFNTFNTVIAGEFRILGTLSLSDNATDDRLIVTGNLTTVGAGETGIISVDTNFATGATDTITVQQNMTGKKTLMVNDVTPANNQTRFLDPIKVVTVTGTTSADALSLNVTRIRSRGYFYTLSFDSASKSFILQGKRGILRCAGTNNSGTFNCTGTIDNPESIIALGNENLNASLARTATVSVDADVAITVSGSAAVTFTQEANGGTLNGTGNATGVIKASTTGNGAVSVQLTGTATLAGSGTAVEAVSTGNGNVTITATNVVASNARATAIKATGRGSQVNVNVATASGGRDGIMARNTGTNGAITVSASGTTTGASAAIDASTTSGSVTISAAAVSGMIMAKNSGGTGNVNVTTTGDVTGAGPAAMMVENQGTGTIAVTAASTVTGSRTDGINVVAGSQVTSLNVTANSVSGVRNAIRASNQGAGATTIVLNGTIQTRNSSAIHVENSGTGAINVTLAGAITGGTQGAAVDTVTDGGATNITLNSGTSISATSGIAIRNDEGASVVTVNSGATLSGSVLLGAGVDTLTFADPSFGTSILNGGTNGDGNTEPVDVLTFNGGSFALEDDRLLNWEKIVIGPQATMTVTANKSIHLTTTDFELSGTVTLQDGATNDKLTIGGNLVGGGTLKLDVDFYGGTKDTINIARNVTGTTKVDIRDISTEIGGMDDQAIPIIAVLGTASSSSFEIVENEFATGAYDYELTYNSADRSFSVTKKQAAGSVMLVSTPIALFDGFARVPSLYERRTVDSNDQYWSRVFTKSNGYGNAREGSAKYDSTNTGFQVGYDIATTTNDLGTIVYGGTIQFNSVEADVSAFNVPGTLSAQGFGIGGTATLYMEDGTYFDGQIQVNQISSDFEVGNKIGSLINGHNSTAFVLSAEAGRRYTINDEYTLLYNGQLSWGSVDSGNATTPRGRAIDFGGDSGLAIRGGVRLEYLSGTNNFYGLANIHLDSMDSWDVTFADETYSDSKSSTFFEIGGGGDIKLSPTASLFGHLAFKTSLKGGVDKRDSTYLSTGVRWSW